MWARYDRFWSPFRLLCTTCTVVSKIEYRYYQNASVCDLSEALAVKNVSDFSCLIDFQILSFSWTFVTDLYLTDENNSAGCLHKGIYS